MDRRTAKKLTEIGIKASRDAVKRGIKVEKPYVNMLDDMKHVANIAKTNEERKAAHDAIREMENSPVLRDTMNREEKVVNEKYNQVVERRTEKMIKAAIRNGEMKAPDKKEYNEYMNRIHKR